jgi:hypothetical protein
MRGIHAFAAVPKPTNFKHRTDYVTLKNSIVQLTLFVLLSPGFPTTNVLHLQNESGSAQVSTVSGGITVVVVYLSRLFKNLRILDWFAINLIFRRPKCFNQKLIFFRYGFTRTSQCPPGIPIGIIVGLLHMIDRGAT